MVSASNDISVSPAERVRQALLHAGPTGAARETLEAIDTHLAACTTPRERIEVRLAVAQYHSLHGNMAEAMSSIADADGDAGDDLTLQALIAYARASVLNRHAAFEDARDALAPYVGMNLADHDLAVAARIHTLYAGVLDSLGRADEAYTHFREAIRLRERIGDPRGLAVVYYNFAESCARGDDHDLALEYFVRAYDIEKGLDDHASVAQSACHIAILMARHGEVTEAERFAEIARDSAYLSGMSVIIAHVMANRASMLEILGRTEEREQVLLETLEFLEQNPVEAVLGPTLGNLGSLYLYDGRIDEAEPLLSRALAWAEANGNRYNEGFWRYMIGRLELDRGNLDRAVNQLTQAVDTLRAIKAHAYALEALHALASAHARKESPAEAFTALAEWSRVYADEHRADMEQRLRTMEDLRLREKKEREEEIYRLRNVELSSALEDLKRVNAELRDLASEKDEFMAIAAHDLRNPLSDARGMLQTIISHFDVLDRSDVLNLCADLLTLTMRMSNTVHAFLEVSRTDKRSTGLVIQPLDLALIAHRARERHATRAAAKDLSLGVELGKDHVWGTGDASVTEAIMDNLVTNAIKYVPTGGAITILVNDDASGPSIAVRDNGPGVDASQAHLLFTKYASIGSKPTGGEESLGLGLYLAQRMASRMGAKISYEPGEDGGSVFTLRVMQ